MEAEAQIREFLQSRFSEAIVSEDKFRGDVSYVVKTDALYDICEAFMDDVDLDVHYLADITSVDWVDHPEETAGRFEVVYNLYSLKHKHRFFLKVWLPGDKPEVKSLTGLWRSANWLEREVYDLMGVVFIDHPNLTKILTPDDLEGHPLRRDFPLTYETPQFSWNKDDPPEVIK